MNKYLTNKTLLSLGILFYLLISMQLAQAQMDNSGSPPQVTCPEPNTFNRCTPLTYTPFWSLDRFNLSDDNTPIEEISFEVRETLEMFDDYYIITEIYSFTDKDGNSSYCEILYNIPERFLRAPAFNQQNQICQDDFFGGLNLQPPLLEKQNQDYPEELKSKYLIYQDDNDKPGVQIGKCDQPGLLCTAEKLGIDITEAGTSKLWITEFITFPDGSLCESHPSLLNIEVVEKPTAKLTTTIHKTNDGTVLNLMDFVEENTHGFWSGAGVYSTSALDGSTVWFYSVNGKDVSKLYYTVSNTICSQSYVLLVDSEE